MVKFMRARGREPPRSTTRRLEFTIQSCWGPGSTGSACGPCGLQGPVGSQPPLDPLAWATMAAVDCLDAVIAGFLCIARALPENCPRWSSHFCSRQHGQASTGVHHGKGRYADVSRTPAVIVRVSENKRVTPIRGRTEVTHDVAPPSSSA
jgi:hypothetical protein